ncbi:alpha/beta fold hydrolase [Rubellimicrobium sp. CFH 75288]|uniref:alpha/beta fold hydrolase n=1 Tax=Rubellimicrobium sp. CFH 75288 TaxID=2697034 RepID=UPI001412B8B6|nr:alpha/beta hydrolase [Rubellimicrobium sp. CFH 75288]NAZ37097.1 alpha/beta fold hydrolase [Rubellimicrobium sp. CFH 75288]
MRGAALLAFLLCGASAVLAQVPSQADWNAAREAVDLPDGPALAFVEVEAPEGAAAADPLILLHGYTDNSRSWSLVMPHLGERRMLALDLRGHGRSEAPACCYGIDSFAHDLLGFMDAMGIERADLAGHSLGAMTAIAFAAAHPERVDRIVLIGAALSLPDAAADWLWQTVPNLEAPIDPEGEFMLDWYWNPTPVNEAFLARERAESAAVPLHVWTGTLQALVATDLAFPAARVTAPTLILWGDQDPLFDGASQDRLREAMPGAEHHVFPGLGHNLLWESPAELGGRIRAFLGP